MPTPRLPDINSSFMRHRGEFIDAVRDGDARRALAAFAAANALLPGELDEAGLPSKRVIIDADLYAERHRHTIVAICPHCGAQHTRKSLSILNVRQPPVTRLLSGRATLKVWYCRPETLLPVAATSPAAGAKPLEKAADEAAAAAEAAGENDSPDQKNPKRRRGRPKQEAAPACGKRIRLDRTEVQDRTHAEPFYCGVIPPPPVRSPGLAGRTPFEQAFRQWAGLAWAEFEYKAAEYRDAHWKRPDEEDGMGSAEMQSLFGGGGASFEDADGAAAAKE